MNLGSVAKQILGTVAPTILTAIGGPFGALAASVLHVALGTNGDDKAADTMLSGATQDTLLKVKQAETDLQAKLAELGVQREQLVYQDLASARAMQIATRDPTAGRLAWLVIGGFLTVATFECVAMVFWAAKWALIPAAALNLLGIIFGFLASEAKQAGAFYFGSSASSQAKDATLAEIAKS